MIILHAGFLTGRLWLWGETPVEAPSTPRTTSRGRRSAVTRSSSTSIPPLPYDAGSKMLSAVWDVIDSRAAHSRRRRTEQMAAWLPTLDGQSLPSSPLIAAPPTSHAKAAPMPWTITAITLPIAAAIELLSQCIERDTLGPGIIIGRDLGFWATAMRFGGALAVREQCVPGVQVMDQGARARWEPVIAGTDADRLNRLAQAMPDACRALTPSDAQQPPEVSARAMLRLFLDEVVDHLMRSGTAISDATTSTVPHSLHDRWLHALQTMDGSLQGTAPELRSLAEQVRTWRRPIDVCTVTPFRLCFRLEEPTPADMSTGQTAPNRRDTTHLSTADWHVRFLLQAADDPSLLIPVADAWSAKGRAAIILRRSGFHAHEYLLTALGQVATLNPHIEQSLNEATPSGYDLDAGGAHEFLSEQSWLLEQAGFGVFLPAWWTRKGTKLRLSMRATVKSPQAPGSHGLSLAQIVQVDWEVALGDQRLSLKELEALARLKAPLVNVRGRWVQIQADEIRAALDFWKRKTAHDVTLRELVGMALGRSTTSGSLPFEGVTASGWIGDLLARLEGRCEFTEMAVPEGFHGTLRPYQVRGYSWLGFLRQLGLGACLADDMGLGKTIQALALIEREWHANEPRRPVLLVCPTSVIGNWYKEAARFTPGLPILVHHGVARARGATFKAQAERYAIVVSSFALLQRDCEILKEVDWSGVILDEAQNIKNPESKQARAARGLPAEYRIALTGTPVENHVGDLWAIMEFLNPGFLGSRAEFTRTFLLPIQTAHDADAAERLKRLTGPFILRRLKTDKQIITDLPEKMEMKVFCTLTKEQASLYAAVVEDAGKALDETTGIQRKGVVLATLSKLKQVCNHPAQFLGDQSTIPGRSGKLARLTDMIEELLAEGDRALVFSQFAEMGAIIQRHVQETFGHEVLFLHGAVPKAQRDRMVARFQATDGDGPRIFVLSLKAGGTGLNLTAANHVFHFDRWWNPAVENQATDRAFRIGQSRHVQVHKFLCAGTFEERIDEMIEQKQAIAAMIVGTGESWLTELSTTQLQALFALRPDAVAE